MKLSTILSTFSSCLWYLFNILYLNLTACACFLLIFTGLAYPGDKCNSTFGIDACAVSSVCVNNICRCIPPMIYFQRQCINIEALRKRYSMTQIKCRSGTECPDGLVCLNQRCDCPLHTKNAICARFLRVRRFKRANNVDNDNNDDSNNECINGAKNCGGIGGVCINGRCLCEKKYKKVDGICVLNDHLKEMHSDDNDGDDDDDGGAKNSICTETKCHCPDGYKYEVYKKLRL